MTGPAGAPARGQDDRTNGRDAAGADTTTAEQAEALRIAIRAAIEAVILPNIVGAPAEHPSPPDRE